MGAHGGRPNFKENDMTKVSIWASPDKPLQIESINPHNNSSISLSIGGVDLVLFGAGTDQLRALVEAIPVASDCWYHAEGEEGRQVTKDDILSALDDLIEEEKASDALAV